MFVSAQGFSEKPPIQFPDNVTDIVFQHPYIIASNYQGIHIYRYMFRNIKDKQAMQLIDNLEKHHSRYHICNIYL